MTRSQATTSLRGQWMLANDVGRKARDTVRARVVDVALTLTAGNVTRAAEVLGMAGSNLRRFLKDHDIDANTYRRQR